MENNERPGSLKPAEKDTKIQLVVNNPDPDESTIDLGRVLHNIRLKTRIYAWVLVLCLVIGICAPLLLYQFSESPLTVTSVVTLRYTLKGRSNPVTTLTAPDGKPLDLTAVSSAPVVQKALDGFTLSKPVTIENIRNNMTVTRVLTEESSRTREVLTGLADAKNVQVYTRLEDTELTYQNRFIVSLTNGFGDEETNIKYDLKDEELRILLNRILDAYNDTLIRQYADVRLPEDRVSLIDTEEMDLPEILDSLSGALDELLTYCGNQTAEARAYRSWQTGRSLNEWMESIRSVQSVNIDYLDAYVYSKGLMRDRDVVSLTYRYRLRTLNSDLDEVAENIEKTEALIRDYRNNEVLVSMQESDSSRTTKMTTSYYNSLVLQQLVNYQQAASLRTELAETQNKLERLETNTARGELAGVETELNNAITAVKELQDGIRAHMAELFESPLFTTYSEHSAPQGEKLNFLKASAKKMILGGAAGAVIACGLWFLAALAPEFRRSREHSIPKAEQGGKEAAEA